MHPKMTVVIPVYKVETYLRQCLDSVVNQTYRNLEILLIDDESPDSSGAICDEYASKDDRIRVVHKQNAGVSAARNDGIRLATGEWITFVDSDDWLDADYYQKMFAAMPAEPVEVLCSSGYIAEYPSKSETKCVFPEPFVDTEGKKTTLLIAKAMAPQCGMGNRTDYGSNAVVWSKFYKTSLLRRIPPMNEHLHPMEDILYSMQLFAQADGVAVCDCMGYHYRQLVSTASTSRFNPAWPQMFDVCEKSMVGFIAARESSDLLADAFNQRELGLIGYMLRCYFFHQDNPAPYGQVAAEIREFKKRPCVFAAVHRKSNRYLSKLQLVLKYALRLPWVWPLKALNTGRQYLRRTRGI